MTRQRINFIVDLLMLIVMWGMLTTGFLIKCVLPPGTGRWLTVMNMNRHDWGSVHAYLAIALCGLLLTHVFLHWQWVCATVQGLFWASGPNNRLQLRVWRMAWGLTMFVILGGGTAAALWQANRMVTAAQPLPQAEGDGHGRWREHRGPTSTRLSDRIPASARHGRRGEDAQCDGLRSGGRKSVLLSAASKCQGNTPTPCSERESQPSATLPVPRRTGCCALAEGGNTQCSLVHSNTPCRYQRERCP